MFESFPKEILDDPEYLEDSVREDLVAPMLRNLGYDITGKNRLLRSKKLDHPFVYIGTKKYGIKIIPDYTLEADGGKKRAILDAKAPNQDILKGKNCEQAFSYAIHPDVRAERYALCNGRYLTIFSVSKVEPLVVLPIDEWDTQWEVIRKYLSPPAILNTALANFKPDFGLYLHKLGVPVTTIQHFVPFMIPVVALASDGNYTIFVETEFDGVKYAISVDFDETRYKELLSALPDGEAEYLRVGMQREPHKVFFESNRPHVHLVAQLQDVLYQGEVEDYSPLLAVGFQKL